MITYGEFVMRVETGNYEYRALLHMRDNARKRFLNLRDDVVEKFELIDKKHTDGLTKNIHELSKAMLESHKNCAEIMRKCDDLFPIEPDLFLETNKF